MNVIGGIAFPTYPSTLEGTFEAIKYAWDKLNTIVGEYPIVPIPLVAVNTKDPPAVADPDMPPDVDNASPVADVNPGEVYVIPVSFP